MRRLVRPWPAVDRPAAVETGTAAEPRSRPVAAVWPASGRERDRGGSADLTGCAALATRRCAATLPRRPVHTSGRRGADPRPGHNRHPGPPRPCRATTSDNHSPRTRHRSTCPCTPTPRSGSRNGPRLVTAAGPPRPCRQGGGSGPPGDCRGVPSLGGRGGLERPDNLRCTWAWVRRPSRPMATRTRTVTQPVGGLSTDMPERGLTQRRSPPRRVLPGSCPWSP